MLDLTCDFVRKEVADSAIIYRRGVEIYENGSFFLREADKEKRWFVYEVDGNYGDYTVEIKFSNGRVETSCDCPYPGTGCKHTVATLLDTRDIMERWQAASSEAATPEALEPYLSAEEIREQALEDRRLRALHESFKVTEGEMLKGEHLVESASGKQYIVTLHDPEKEKGHCTCPDFLSNRLGTCKHLIFLSNYFEKKRDFKKRIAKERFPFVDIYWDSVEDKPRLFSEWPISSVKEVNGLLSKCFNEDGSFTGKDLTDLLPLISRLNGNKRIRVQENVLGQLQRLLQNRQMSELAQNIRVPPINRYLKTRLYPYQEEGVKFCLFKGSALIGDEMGLGKTLQAIALAILKKEIFGFTKVLVITPASLKEQWKREIERFSDEKAIVVAGSPAQRRSIYLNNDCYFKITNYEAVLRDVMVLSRFKPDLVILDEAQRIKNFSTKTADAVKQIPRKQALVLTGTPLENKLEDVYSIMQFLDPGMLSPLWQFAADHFMLSRKKKGKILGYRNLEKLRDKLKPIVIRRQKEEVLSDLPDEVVNNYYVDLHDKQRKIHSGYMQALLPLLNKKYLTPIDVRRIQELLVRMRMVCNSTYLIDRRTNISPKLDELVGIVDEMVVQSGRKMVIFSEWTTMTFLIARHLSEAGIPFVELSGKIPVKKRQDLIDEFTRNPECKVFLSTDAGGTGLNLQAADCVVNFELPWNPARLNQRVGRVNRIGQKSRCINVINLIAKNSIEEKIMAGIQLKADLFKGVFEGGIDKVEFSHEKRVELLNRLRAMMGEEPLVPTREASPSEEIPEDTPHYLNPEVLKKREDFVDVTAEEGGGESLSGEKSRLDAGVAPTHTGEGTSDNQVPDIPPEKIEAVLDSGMQFISGLLEMATGQKIAATEEDGRMVKVDRSTGEVTFKFKLPSF
ncbi:MAG: DEAD/DEAH box helicase family protein [Deltaproteobacteria bacterium]|nr:DEAD/DEAH box helicase family protein [Deltaproteobacteria bacterium]